MQTAFAHVKRQMKWISFSIQHYELKTTETVNISYSSIFIFNCACVALCMLFRRKKDFKVLIRFGILLLKAYKVRQLKNVRFVLPLTALTSSTSYSIAYVASHRRTFLVKWKQVYFTLIIIIIGITQQKSRSKETEQHSKT